MFFFSSLTNGGATILNEHRYHGGEIWTSSDVARFDPDREIRLDSPHQWLAPIKWNQGGYDAVFYEFKDLDNTECDRSAREAGFTMKIFVRIVQVTRSETHSFKVEYFKDLLSRFTALQPMWLYAVEVCFVVPSDVVSDFTLPVDKVTFRREGVEPAFYSVMVATDICIRVVALEYETWRPKKRLKRN
ncbi:hypothetical protein PR003_g10890 [Phytophthora rubi]|nr:hypothetical protein PR003_g10890 [Phytophthora rubi]